MKMQNCFEAYEEGCRHRLRRPLHEGRYKLENFRDNMSQWNSELLYIRRFMSKQDEKPCFLCCTRAELPSWLKRLPSLIAYDIGHDLLPGMEALVHEGVPSHLIGQDRPHIQSRAMRLLYQLDQLSQVIGSGVEAQYHEMRQGRSRLESVLEQAISLADRAMQIGNNHRGACTPVPNQKSGNHPAQSSSRELSCQCF